MEQWEQVNAVQNMQDYIHQHLYEPITLAELSRKAGYSPFHSAKLFKEHIGKAPFEYIRSLRLSRAALKLRDEKVRVLDVALDFVFDSHEGFTRAFSREFGVTPYQYSKNPQPIKLFMPIPVRDEYLFYQSGGASRERRSSELAPGTVFVQVVERPERKLILKRGRRQGIILNTAKRWTGRSGACYAVSKKPFTNPSECGCRIGSGLKARHYTHRG